MSDAPAAPLVYAALADVMEEVQAVAKKDRNDHQGFSFRGIDAVVNAVGPALRTHRVIVMPTDVETESEQVEVGKNRSLMAVVRVVVTYTFYAEDGSSVACRVAGEAMDSGDKATPKAMSVAFRTALLQALALPTDEPDPDSHTYERAPAASMADLDAAIAEAQEAGVSGDFDATRTWAEESHQNLEAAIRKVRKAIAEKAAA